MKRLWIFCLVLGLLALIPSALAEDWDAEWDAPGYVEGDTLILPEGITALGSYVGDWVMDPETGELDVVEHPEERARFEGAYEFLDGYFDNQLFSAVQWPSTLRYLGCEAFVGYHFRELTLPATLEKMYSDSILYAKFDVLRIEAELPWEMIFDSILSWDASDNVIGAYEAPEDHPLYKTVDGVLFTKDGKTLLSYPNGRTATHYDVPKGVEHIADQAFANEYLQTVSLPIGLITVGDYGFSGCTRLQSIALPLTVTEIGKEIFDNCVSLELVSLPEGLQADKQLDDWWAVYYRDEDRYRGDNGDTFPSPDARPESMYTDDGIYLMDTVRLVGPGTKVFAEPWEEEKNHGEGDAYRLLLDPGSVYRISYCHDDQALLRDPFTRENVGWVSVGHVEYLPGQTLFTWAEIEPRAVMPVWRDHVPRPGKGEIPQEMEISLDPDLEYTATCFGPFLVFMEWSTDDSFACRIQDAESTREPDGTDQVFGIVYNEDVFADVPLRSGPGGEITESLIGGTQIRVLDQDENGCFVTTGTAEGWAAWENIKIIPEKQEGN